MANGTGAWEDSGFTVHVSWRWGKLAVMPIVTRQTEHAREYALRTSLDATDTPRYLGDDSSPAERSKQAAEYEDMGGTDYLVLPEVVKGDLVGCLDDLKTVDVRAWLIDPYGYRQPLEPAEKVKTRSVNRTSAA